MALLPMNKLGASEPTPGTLTFGIFLPSITPTAVKSVFVCVITEVDEMRTGIAPVSVAMTHSTDPTYGDYWAATLTISSSPPPSTWGAKGTYLYWYEVVLLSGAVIDRLIDPFAREFGFKDLSAITVGYVPRSWGPSENAWKTPALSDLVIYEVELNEFGGSLAGSQSMLPYLQELGATAIEVMPVTNVATIIDWGYGPLGYFGVDQRFGNRANFQAFVEAAHAAGLAVILDMVYGHTHAEFLYKRVYCEANIPNPVMGPDGQYGPTPLFSSPLMGDFFYTVNQFWLQNLHVDGFRYDNVATAVVGFWDGAGGGYYPALAEATYRLVVASLAAGPSPDWQRFSSGGGAPTLIQAPECLENPVGILNNTFSNCAWQNATLSAATQAAAGQPLYGLGMQSGLFGYPTTATVNGVTLAKSALQYVETHDHQRFVCNYGMHPTDELQSELLEEGNRTDGDSYVGRWFAVQPLLILIFLGKGVPFLWQGQEIGENYHVPEDPNESGRIRLFRPVRWGEYANDLAGMSLSKLLRSLARIRKGGAQFRTGDHAFINDAANYQLKGLLVFTRTLGSKTSLVALNFTNFVQNASYAFTTSGTYIEEIDGAPSLAVTAGTPCSFSVPSNYGRVWTSP